MIMVAVGLLTAATLQAQTAPKPAATLPACCGEKCKTMPNCCKVDAAGKAVCSMNGTCCNK